MATNFPTALDTLTNPTATDKQNVVSHAAQHADANDAIEALEAKVGANGSAVATSHDYKLSAVTGTAKAVASDDARLTDARTPTAHDHDARYYTKAEVDAAVAGAGGSDPSAAWPVGSIFIAVVNTNPATLLGFGTWQAFAAGRVLVGHNAADADFNAAEKTGGAKTSSAVVNHTHDVTVTDPGHSHTKTASNTAATSGTSITRGTGTQATVTTNTATTGITAATANPAGGVASFSLMNPFITVFMWKRTA